MREAPADVGTEECADGWWVVVDEDHEYAGPFPSEEDAEGAAERIVSTEG